MQLLKKILVLVLFVSLITGLVLYKSNFFDKELKNSQISYNQHQESNKDNEDLDLEDFFIDDMRLHITYQKVIELDTVSLLAFKKIKKTYRLSRFLGAAFSSKTIVLHEEYLPIVCKNEEIRKQLKELNIVRAGAKTGLAKLKVSEIDLKEVIKLVKSGDLSKDKKYTYYLQDKKNIDLNWKVLKDVVYVSCDDNLMNVIKPEKANEFLAKHGTYEADHIKTEFGHYTDKSVMSSSKSFFVVGPEITSEVLEESMKRQEKIKKEFVKLMTVE